MDLDGANPLNKVNAVGGKLHVNNTSGNASVTEHGLYAGQVLRSGNARVYFWGVDAVGSRDTENPNNAGGGPLGTFNLSTADGVQDGFAGNTPMGIYTRNRDIGSGNYQTEGMRIVESNNPWPAQVLTEGADYDFCVDYGVGEVSHYYKLSSSDTWIQLGVAEPVTLSADMYLNLSSWSDYHSAPGEASDWTMEQIDVTDSDYAVLTSPYVPPVPPPTGTVVVVR